MPHSALGLFLVSFQPQESPRLQVIITPFHGEEPRLPLPAPAPRSSQASHWQMSFGAVLSGRSLVSVVTSGFLVKGLGSSSVSG